MQNNRQKLSALILEPDKSQQKGIAITLMDYCSEIKLVEKPTDALSMIFDRNFDIIITEIKFSVDDGLEIVKKFRQQSPKSIIIVCSAYINNSIQKRLNNISIQAIIEKPINLEFLRKKLNNL